MDDLTKHNLAQIRQLYGDLQRYEAAVPNAIEYLLWLRRGGAHEATWKVVPEFGLSGYLDTLSRYLKLVHRVSGNFPLALFQSDETVKLMAWGYTVLLQDRLIPHTQAMGLLGLKNLFGVSALLYPRTGEPRLTAYFDPASAGRGRSARVDIVEVKRLAEELRT